MQIVCFLALLACARGRIRASRHHLRRTGRSHGCDRGQGHRVAPGFSPSSRARQPGIPHRGQGRGSPAFARAQGEIRHRAHGRGRGDRRSPGRSGTSVTTRLKSWSCWASLVRMPLRPNSNTRRPATARTTHHWQTWRPAFRH